MTDSIGRGTFRITAEPLDARGLEQLVADPSAGAVCTFSGVVRDNTDGVPTTHLEYEAYSLMAETQISAIMREACQRWPGLRIAGAHRTGNLAIGEPSVIISVAAAHRADAINACRYCIDELKERLPIWKKEFRTDGSFWVEGATRVATKAGTNSGRKSR
jgi:molybdopterin synthase catalytic subunit